MIPDLEKLRTFAAADHEVTQLLSALLNTPIQRSNGGLSGLDTPKIGDEVGFTLARCPARF